MRGVGVPVGACFVEYRPIPGFGLYVLGSDRTVWSRFTGQWRRLKVRSRMDGGATDVMLTGDDGMKVGRSLNRLMREVFPPVDADEEDGRSDPWSSFGEDNGRAKITKAQAEELRRLRKMGWAVRDLARRYGISRSNVYAVDEGLSWADTPPDMPDPAPADEMPAPMPRPAARHRGPRLDRRHDALRQRPTDATPLEQLEMPRAKPLPAAPVPFEEAEARRLHTDGWTVRDLVARYRVRPHVIVAILKGAPG